jgi:hypothetical protein
MTERWLLVGITRKEIRDKKYSLPTKDFITLDRGDFGPFHKGDIDFKHDAFNVETWKRIRTIFGPRSFDVIFTDGGLFGIKRVDEIINIKRSLLKNNGCIVNYLSPCGLLIRCPFGRPLHFYAIGKNDYTIRKLDKAIMESKGNTLREKMLKEMKIII